MPASLTLVGDPSVQASLDAVTELTATRLLVLDLGDAADENAVSEAATALIRQLRSDAPAGVFEQTRTLVVAAFAADRSPAQEAFRAAAIQALRGIVQSLTREFAHHLQPINLLVIDRADTAAAKVTLDYLDEADGGYTAGFTLDITTQEAAA